MCCAAAVTAAAALHTIAAAALHTIAAAAAAALRTATWSVVNVVRHWSLLVVVIVVVNGHCWSLVIGCWSLAIGCWLSLVVVCCWLSLVVIIVGGCH